jgi:hypothetical protein
LIGWILPGLSRSASRNALPSSDVGPTGNSARLPVAPLPLIAIQPSVVLCCEMIS